MALQLRKLPKHKPLGNRSEGRCALIIVSVLAAGCVPAEPIEPPGPPVAAKRECAPIYSGTGGPHVIATSCMWEEINARMDAFVRCYGPKAREPYFDAPGTIILREGGSEYNSLDYDCAPHQR